MYFTAELSRRLVDISGWAGVEVANSVEAVVVLLAAGCSRDRVGTVWQDGTVHSGCCNIFALKNDDFLKEEFHTRCRC